jgi:hypothetical protein
VAARGRGRGGQGWGKGGVGGQEKGKREGATTRVLWEKETTPQISPDFASNGPQLFPSSTHRRSTFGQYFLGYYNRAGNEKSEVSDGETTGRVALTRIPPANASVPHPEARKAEGRGKCKKSEAWLLPEGRTPY